MRNFWKCVSAEKAAHSFGLLLSRTHRHFTSECGVMSRAFDIHGSMHRRNTNKMQLVMEFIIQKFIEGSTCFERHTAHHQEL